MISRKSLAICLLWLSSLLAFSAVADTSGAGTYQRIKVYGKALEGNLGGNNPERDVSIYLPADYETHPEKRYPVLYLLHGYTDSDARWFGVEEGKTMTLQAMVDAADKAGVKEMIVVMPNAFTRYWGSMYSSSATVGDWETFVAEDLVSYIDSHYRTLAQRESRGLAGHSMGGYGTLRIGMKFPDVFSAIYALNPCCLPPFDPSEADAAKAAYDINSAESFADAPFGIKAMVTLSVAWSPDPQAGPGYYRLPVDPDGSLRPDVIAAWNASSPLSLVHQYLPAMRSFTAIGLDAGNDDMQGIEDATRQFHEILDGYGIANTFEIYAGDHGNRVPERMIKVVLPFFDNALAFA